MRIINDCPYLNHILETEFSILPFGPEFELGKADYRYNNDEFFELEYINGNRMFLRMTLFELDSWFVENNVAILNYEKVVLRFSIDDQDWVIWKKYFENDNDDWGLIPFIDEDTATYFETFFGRFSIHEGKVYKEIENYLDYFKYYNREASINFLLDN